MAKATRTMVIVQFNPDRVSLQSDIIGPATVNSAGVLPAGLIPQVNALIGSFRRNVVQPADGSDFLVDVPINFQQPDGNYRVSMTIGTAGVFTNYSVDFLAQTGTQFRVTTDGALPNGTPLIFSMERL